MRGFTAASFLSTPRGQFIALAVVSLHLLLVLSGAVSIDWVGLGRVGKAIEYYRLLSGANYSFGFLPRAYFLSNAVAFAFWIRTENLSGPPLKASRIGKRC